LFYDYTWPGNVRELENVIERAMIMCSSDTIAVGDLPREFKENVYNVLHIEGIPADAKLNETLAMIEQKMVERALKLTDNVQAQAADLLGIGKSGLNWKLKKFNLDARPKK
jgi:two-component system NtrC family response regulator